MVTNYGRWTRPPHTTTNHRANAQRRGEFAWQEHIEPIARCLGEQVWVAFHRRSRPDVQRHDKMIRSSRIGAHGQYAPIYIGSILDDLDHRIIHFFHVELAFASINRCQHQLPIHLFAMS
jgi:hypothetical protein